VSPADSKPSSDSRRPLLRRLDQAAVGALTLAALCGIAIWWLAHGGATGRLIEIDRAPRQAAQFRLDINHADWPEFSQLPGIGETLAHRIVESRDADGAFADVEQLRRVRGIGPKTLERMRPYLRPIPRAGDTAGGVR